MTLVVWFSLLVACLLLSLAPGAGAVNTMSTSLKYGWKRTIWSILGLQLALLTQIIIVAAGLGVVIANSPVLFNIIRYLGAAYLVYLGLHMILAHSGSSSSSDQVEHQKKVGRRTPGSTFDLIQRGFWVNMSNPKAIVFILAFMPQFIKPDLPQLPQYLMFTATMILCDTFVMWGIFAVIAKSFSRLNQSTRGQKILNLIFGSLFIAMAALLIFAIH